MRSKKYQSPKCYKCGASLINSSDRVGDFCRTCWKTYSDIPSCGSVGCSPDDGFHEH